MFRTVSGKEKSAQFVFAYVKFKTLQNIIFMAVCICNNRF